MANFNKSFNFRNGVQVDNDNFIVNANGLVGIGTTIPKDYLLNVYGDTRVTGLVTANNLYIVNSVTTGISTVGFLTASDINVSGVVTATSFSGSASGLTGIYAIAVDGWYVDAGFISTTSNVGIATTLPTGNFQVGTAVTINSDGNATYTGIITALSFDGNIDAANISLGTLSNDRLPSDINISGVVTASSFVGIGSDLTLLNADNISSGTLSNSRLPSDIDVAGIVTAYSFSGFGTDISGINASNISSGTLSNSRLPSDIDVAGIVTATGGFVGNVTGTASTAQSLVGSPDIVVGIATASNSLNVGTAGTGFSALSSGNIGVGTAIPTSEIQVRKASGSLVEVVSDSGEARISIGQSVGVGKSTGVIRFGNSANDFDIINRDTGNINMYLHGGGSGIGTGRFDWIYGQTNAELMSLTYGGSLGIGITNPDNTLHVVGTSTVTGNAFVGGNLSVDGSISGTITFPSLITGSNLNNNSGVSTFFGLDVDNGAEIFGNIIVSAGSSIGIGTDVPITDVDAFNKILVVGAIGVGESFDNIENRLPDIGSIYTDGQIICDGVGIGTTSLGSQSRTLMVLGNVELYPGIEEQGGPPAQISYVKGTKVEVAFDNESRIGIGTTVSQASVDFRLAGKGIGGGAASFMMPPQVSTTVGLNTAGKEGALVFNTTTKKFQGYTGTAWVDLH